MRVEIPEFKRCCFCLPLRRGIILFGYLNLVFAVLIMVIELYSGGNTFTMYKGIIVYVNAWLPVALYALEFIFNVILLVGAHMKKPVLLRVFYYYGITTTLAAIVILFFTRFMDTNWMDKVFEALFVFSGLVVTGYILILVRAELKKLEEPSHLIMMSEIPSVTTENRNFITNTNEK